MYSAFTTTIFTIFATFTLCFSLTVASYPTQQFLIHTEPPKVVQKCSRAGKTLAELFNMVASEKVTCIEPPPEEECEDKMAAALCTAFHNMTCSKTMSVRDCEVGALYRCHEQFC
ncbi:hypothetical protein BU24DRAFT_81083 [Aaosphaeria arxii CBS 175.79]|uniref:Extracellular membrane protein CFEM domain-containing protein n=1 Tax=Aaosphaeria arxii CBS 175.79 TaxID=1450172 RepID=A0A6A5X9I6_9PLEO|nr:uncharacterized protein BU24DRAFT_81083 [Aaosphaeria arxii CBS 175.79]KAF2009705.1 hypothetical protein BU24DRAFT_81083 [Aaosphaeria arxii CBS 175.79]